MTQKFSLILLWIILAVCEVQAQKKDQAVYSLVAFWNVENLYDTLNDPLKDDDEFTPEGSRNWNSEKYRLKLQRLAEVISFTGAASPAGAPAFMGFCEIENRKVMEDLVSQPLLQPYRYRVVHLEGEDARGVDPSFIYQEDRFELTGARLFPVRLQDSLRKTRPVLAVSGELCGHSLLILINHWPSRRNGKKESEASRLAAASVVRSICDSVANFYPGRLVLIMGDFNDDPGDLSLRRLTRGRSPADTAFYNPFEQLHRAGRGTLAWRDRWNLFDQILFSRSWLEERSGLRFLKADVYAPRALYTPFGNYRDYPFRTFSGAKYTGGYSDHFPVYALVEHIHPCEFQQGTFPGK